MAVQHVTPAVVPPAQVVGNAFVNQYYNVLHQSPHMVYRFYQESSKLGRPDSNGEMVTVTTMEGINDNIMSLDYSDFKAVIKTVDSQDSYHSGVLVLVTGSLSCKSSGIRNFTQSFFLAPQDKGYFVLNDMLKYLDDEPMELNQSLVSKSDATEVAVKASIPEQAAEIMPVVENGISDELEQASEVVEETVVEEACSHSENGEDLAGEEEEEAAPEQLPEAVNNEVPPAPEAPAVVLDAPKKSYASIVKVMKEGAVPVAVHRPSLRAVPPNAERQTAVPTPPKASAPESFSPTSGNAMDNSNPPEVEASGCSIYIKNLPVNVTAPQLEEEFKKFGAVKLNGVQVRSKPGGFCYGFVEFELSASVQGALEASPVLISGRPAFVEEKRPSSGTTRVARGRFLPSRGGSFRNDGIRGRGAYGGAYGGRGNGRNDFNNRGDLGNRGRGSVSGRGAGFSESPETFQRDDQFRNSGRGVRRGSMNQMPRIGSVAA